jgi:hypothetical protein
MCGLKVLEELSGVRVLYWKSWSFLRDWWSNGKIEVISSSTDAKKGSKKDALHVS